MANKNMLEIVLARAEQSKQDKTKILNLKTEALGDITVIVPPFKKLTDWIDEVSDMGETVSTWDITLANAELVFDCTPFLKGNFAQLSEAYEEKEPPMLTVRIFEAANAIGELNDIAEKITSSIGANKAAIKNS